MPYNGSGVFTLVAGNPVVTGTIISSTWANNTLADIANNGLSSALTKDGQQTPTANINLGGFQLINVGNATTRTAAPSAGQVQDNQLVVLSAIAGTGDAITASTAPAITAIATDSKWIYTPTTTNTISNPTINLNALGAKTITQSNGIGLWAAAFVVGTPYELLYDGTNFRVQSGAFGAPVNNAQILIPGASSSFRNRFIDGNFDFWDTVTTVTPPTGVDTYAADMWLTNTGSSGTATITQRLFAPGGEPLQNTSPCRNFMQWNQTVSATINPVLGQKIESVATFEGRSCTLSVKLWVNASTLTIPSVKVVQNFGTGGSPSGQTVTTVTTGWNVTTAVQTFSVRIDVPSTTGKTLGTNSNDNLFVALNLPSGLTFTLNISQMQVEDCPAGAPTAGLPTQFEFRGYALEKSLITRYLRVYSAGSIANQTLGQAAISNSTSFFANFVFENPMRAQPALAWGNLSIGLSTTMTVSTLVINVATPQSVALLGSTPPNGFVAGQIANFFTTNSAGFLVLDARL